ncbi:predicted protein [Postia placenta Mad-698-R]|uniref:F-box domain-containing protein n=1 Tax=Postia placenta MAD-698-R-SB12 TaxID=670580 RepID=A0A1X6N031_9APHY|nr:hypothetical protein POSPLADRAFT_1046459 [Postia placenta MAD-698-R-SB12]EED82698.1 predicted protein [Postia placenta Mad-698-R]OSX61965.1 hypothetical protein POSPLADRAFT_1046459 [Postia placenta MAD-698-R-SB12]
MGLLYSGGKQFRKLRAPLRYPAASDCVSNPVESASRRALRIDEILRMVVAFLHGHPKKPDTCSVLQFAVTCSTFLEPSLSILWETQHGLDNILRLLPCDTWRDTATPDGKKILELVTDVPLNAHLPRFVAYTSFVKNLFWRKEDEERLGIASLTQFLNPPGRFNLTTFSSTMEIDGEGVLLLAQMHNLKALELSLNCKSLAGVKFQSDSFPSLEVLNLSLDEMDESTLRLFKSIPSTVLVGIQLLVDSDYTIDTVYAHLVVLARFPLKFFKLSLDSQSFDDDDEFPGDKIVPCHILKTLLKTPTIMFIQLDAPCLWLDEDTLQDMHDAWPRLLFLSLIADLEVTVYTSISDPSTPLAQATVSLQCVALHVDYRNLRRLLNEKSFPNGHILELHTHSQTEVARAVAVAQHMHATFPQLRLVDPNNPNTGPWNEISRTLPGHCDSYLVKFGGLSLADVLPTPEDDDRAYDEETGIIRIMYNPRLSVSG